MTRSWNEKDRLIQTTDLDWQRPLVFALDISVDEPARDFLASVAVCPPNGVRSGLRSGPDPALASEFVEVELQAILKANPVSWLWHAASCSSFGSP
jgi:hypothetical protein